METTWLLRGEKDLEPEPVLCGFEAEDKINKQERGLGILPTATRTFQYSEGYALQYSVLYSTRNRGYTINCISYTFPDSE